MHRFEMVTADQLVMEDPFSGCGLFVPLAEGQEEILAALYRAFEVIVPAVAWPGHGAWIDTRGLDGTGEQALARWENR